MPSLVVDIQLDAEQYQQYYQQPGATVVARARDGRRVRFPATLLQSFVTHSGVSGSFELVFDESGKWQSIARIAGP